MHKRQGAKRPGPKSPRLVQKWGGGCELSLSETSESKKSGCETSSSEMSDCETSRCETSWSKRPSHKSPGSKIQDAKRPGPKFSIVKHPGPKRLVLLYDCDTPWDIFMIVSLPVPSLIVKRPLGLSVIVKLTDCDTS